ncbi:MAG: sigma-70 family RNA polymerase sigma factor [Gemmatimonadota bacterium]
MDEATLTTRASQGDSDAFGELVVRHAMAARRVALAVLRNADEADDAVQSATLSAWRAIARYDPDRSFRAWYLRIIANAALDQFRRRRVRAAEPLSDWLESRTVLPDQATERALLRDRLMEGLAQLPERQRVALVLFDAEGYSHSEIAAVLKVPEGTVRSYVFHARRAMRRILAPAVEEEIR